MLVRRQNSILNEIVVEKLVYGGEGLGRIDGKVVLVPYVLPGERVKFESVSESKGLMRGRLVEILEPSAARSEPGCEYFARCGGCAYQHTTDEEQLIAKRAILTEVLQRVGKLTAPEIGVESGPSMEYRNRVQLHVQAERIGFHQAGTHTLQPILRCPIAAPRLNEALTVLRKMAHQPRFPSFVKSLELFTNGDEVQLNILESGGRRVARGFFDWCAKSIPGVDKPTIDYEALGKSFRVGHRSFFQVNRFLIERLAGMSLAGAEGETALDLYAGVGLLTLPLRERVPKVTAVESGWGAGEDLKFNAERAGVSVTVERNTAELFLEGLTERPDFILADPPRSGLGKGVVRQLLRLRPARLNVVSCDPATLARDLAALLAGGYELEAMTLVDLFPQTHHIETVVRLRMG